MNAIPLEEARRGPAGDRCHARRQRAVPATAAVLAALRRAGADASGG